MRVLPGVSPERALEWHTLGQELGLTHFNPTWVNWDHPAEWKATGVDDGDIMPQSVGYAIEVGFGVFFSILTLILTFLETKFAGVVITSEHFNTAGRDVKTGLTASVIVSQWTWAATLLQSSNVAWQYGITGPFWYASGASIQVLVFGILAIEVKRKAPNAHTFLEMIDVRWGKCAHITFLFFAIATNIIVSSMLLLGGCAVMDAAAKVPIEASSFLIPLGTLIYTLVGGLKATFLASYLHTTIIFVGLIIFVTLVYAFEFQCRDATVQCNSLGSASIVYERLKFMNALPTRTGTVEVMVDGAMVNRSGFHQGPAFATSDGNRGGSYLTMMSLPGFKFGVINVVGNFGTVFVDQSYWQSAIAASPAAAHKGYLLGGLVWFTIPFALATSLGLAGNALNVALTTDDADAGLVPPASATVLMGQGGGILMIIMLFMAITSTGSAECIAVSSLWSYDIYRRYINPEATGGQILMHSRIMVIVWAILMGVFSIILNAIGVKLGWVYNFMGICIGSAVVPVACVVLWSKVSAIAAVGAAWGGIILSVITWLVVASSEAANVRGANQSAVDLDSTGDLEAQLAGNCVAIGGSFIIMLILTCIFPQDYDWAEMNKNIKLVGGDGGENANVLGQDWESSPEFLESAKQWIMKYGIAWTFFLTVGWPVMTMPWGVFSESIYSLWASIAICWGYTAGFTIIFLPIWENKDTICRVLSCRPVTVPSSVPGEKTETATA
jgi:SSS family transporter